MSCRPVAVSAHTPVPLTARPDHSRAGFGNTGPTAGHAQGDLRDRLSPDHASPGPYAGRNH